MNTNRLSFAPIFCIVFGLTGAALTLVAQVPTPPPMSTCAEQYQMNLREINDNLSKEIADIKLQHRLGPDGIAEGIAQLKQQAAEDQKAASAAYMNCQDEYNKAFHVYQQQQAAYQQQQILEQQAAQKKKNAEYWAHMDAEADQQPVARTPSVSHSPSAFSPGQPAVDAHTIVNEANSLNASSSMTPNGRTPGGSNAGSGNPGSVPEMSPTGPTDEEIHANAAAVVRAAAQARVQELRDLLAKSPDSSSTLPPDTLGNPTPLPGRDGRRDPEPMAVPNGGVSQNSGDQAQGASAQRTQALLDLMAKGSGATSPQVDSVAPPSKRFDSLLPSSPW